MASQSSHSLSSPARLQTPPTRSNFTQDISVAARLGWCPQSAGLYQPRSELSEWQIALSLGFTEIAHFVRTKRGSIPHQYCNCLLTPITNTTAQTPLIGLHRGKSSGSVQLVQGNTLILKYEMVMVMVMVGYQDLVRTHRTWNGLIMGGCHSVDIKMREMTNDVDESVTAHNGGNDHDQCHHHHDTHPGRKWWTCSNIVTQCWEMSSNISSLFYVEWCQPYSGKIFLITLLHCPSI